jgi:hypothetical protein
MSEFFFVLAAMIAAWQLHLIHAQVDKIASMLEELKMQSSAAGGQHKVDPHGGPTAAVPNASVVRCPPLADSAQQPLPNTVRPMCLMLQCYYNRNGVCDKDKPCGKQA